MRNIKRHHIKYTVILLLLFTAGFLSFGIVKNYQKIKPQNMTQKSDVKLQNTIAKNDVKNKELPPPPAMNASEKDRKTYRDIVMSMAVNSNSLTIQKNCSPITAVLGIDQGKELTIKNTDSVKHTIVINDEYKFDIPANGEKKVKADFGRGKGIYDYACDTSLAAKGLFLIR